MDNLARWRDFFTEEEMIGRRVAVRVKYFSDDPEAGTVGTIRSVDSENIGVEFEDFCGHTLGGLVKNHSGWWLLAERLEFADEDDLEALDLSLLL